MDSRLIWILASVVLWIVLRTLARRLSGSRQQSVRARWLAGFRTRRQRPRLRHRPENFRKNRTRSQLVVVTQPPHAFPRRGRKQGEYFDLSRDWQSEKLARFQLPELRTPDDLAVWAGIPVNRLAWLAHRCTDGKPRGVDQTHYVYTWKAKRSGGSRLIESPKADLKNLQRKILAEILGRLPVSPAAHGFVTGRSIVTNAGPHVRAAVVVRFDLQDFYVSIRGICVTRMYRRLGYSREAAWWLSRLTTSVIPGNLPIPQQDHYGVWRYHHRHLPQGAPTSPALANLIAFALDQRLSGLAESFGARYTRYADDLTFSGDEQFSAALRAFIPLVEQIIRQEGFRSNRAKRQVLRQHQRQLVTGVVVNQRPNVCRKDYDRLKAILHHCQTHGPASQNREHHPDFAAHLRGRIAHVAQLNPRRGEKLWQQFEQIRW